MMESCLLIAGEKSGEEHALTFFPELTKLCPEVRFYGVGGDDLERAGLELLYHLRDFSSMGFSEVIGKVPFYFRALRQLEEEVRRRGTRTAIVVDFQDFNLRLAQRLSKLGVRVLYYVAPQAWAWKAGRARKLAQSTHTLFTILPFEKEWFSERGVKQVRSIPHPLMRTYEHELRNLPPRPFGAWKEKLRLLLLPGSRRFEVAGLLPEFIAAARALRQSYDLEVHLVKVPHLDQRLYEIFAADVDVWHTSEDIASAMKSAHFALAASGTVTLSTGLFELPTVVCYRGSLLNEFIYYNLIRYPGPISLTNIILGQRVFPEFTQGSAVAPVMVRALRAWLDDEKTYNKTIESLKETKHLLRGEELAVPEYMARVIHE
jgi:lipid-A-disaccharide synthase